MIAAGNPPVERNYPDGSFQLRYYEGERMMYMSVGTDASKAIDAQRVQENKLKAQIHATAAGIQIVEDPDRRTLTKAYRAFLQATEDRGSTEARVVYETALDEFFQVVRKTYADELTAEDLLLYQRHLRTRGKAPRTIYNRWANVKAFYLYCGLDTKAMKIKAPKYEEQTPEVYEPEEMKVFFPAIADDPSFYAACQIMLKCGLRDQEIRYLEWPQVNLGRGVLHIRGNATYGFKVKDSEERNVPMPKELVTWLEKYRSEHPKDRLVTHTKNGKPNTKLLKQLKGAARRAGLNCNACDGCERVKECEHWFLHKFRATAITMWLRSRESGGAGLDLRTVMKLSGHSDLASVMRYLSPASDDAVQRQVSAIAWGD